MDHSLKTFANLEGSSTNYTSKTEQSGFEEVKKSSSCRVAAVCLGVLCLLLLIALSITQVILYTKGRSERVQLQTSYNDLTKERDQLQTSYNNLTKEQDQLQTSYNDLTKERDQLQTSNNDLTMERDQLQTSNNNLTKERDQLQTSYNDLTKERDHLQTSYDDLTKERDHLQVFYDGMTKEFQALGYVYFRRSLYYISSVEKSWQESRYDCWWRGADLVIINNKEEQDFLTSLQRRTWIGLTDHWAQGTWSWVDGSPLNISYWAPAEPNSLGREACVEMTAFYSSENNWYNLPCDSELHWICEIGLSW